MWKDFFFLGKGYLPASYVFCFSLCHVLCTCIVFCTYLQYFIGVFYLLIPPPPHGKYWERREA